MNTISYNGVIFDVECQGPYDIEIKSLSVAGMLGRVVSVVIHGMIHAWQKRFFFSHFILIASLAYSLVRMRFFFAIRSRNAPVS